MIVAVIPARGGSKGIPRKNLCPIGGIPLVAHTVLHAVRSRLIDLTIVSTDDDEIAGVATRYGATVVCRPAELSTDEAPSESAVRHALDAVRSEHGPVDVVALLQPTSPLRQAGELDAAIGRLRSESLDSMFSACRQHSFVWRSRSHQQPVSLTYDHRARPRRQDLDGQDWQENGSFYLFRTWVLDELGNRLGGKIGIWPMHPLDSFQVDEPGDLDLIESLYAMRATRRHASELSRARLLVLDFDGVLTDNRVLVDENGVEAVFCDRRDGWGIARVVNHGVPVVILSTEENPVVAARSRKLGIECVQGCRNKERAIREIAKRHDTDLADVAFVANDVNDIDALRRVGIPIAVADAHARVQAVARFTTALAGGHGAVREVCDAITDWSGADLNGLGGQRRVD